jgi:Na+/melibiose symporter-like transporter
MEIEKKGLEEGLEHMEKIEEQLEEIKVRTGSTSRAFFYGLMYGAGWVVGTILTIALLGWILSLFGVIPGFAQIADNLRAILNSRIH